MSKVADFPLPQKSGQLQPDKLSDERVGAIRRLIETLSPAEQERLFRELTDMLRPNAGARSGDVLGVLVRLLPQRTDWTVAEIKQGVEALGVGATAKEIYNALGYLTRKRQIRRVGYGRYLFGGIPVVTTDAFGGEPSITEGDLDD